MIKIWTFSKFTNNNMQERVLLKGLREVAKKYRIGLSTAKRLMEEVPCFRIGNTFCCYTDEIENYLKNKEKENGTK